MKKRTLALLLCIALVTLVAVNDTLATTVQGWFNDLTQWLTDDGRPTTGDALQVDVVSDSGKQILTPSHYDGDFPGIDKVSAVTNTTYAKNTAGEDAFVRLCMFVKKDKVLKHSDPVFSAADYVYYENDQLDGYTLYVFDYKHTLGKQERTPEITIKVALTKETTNDDLQRLGMDFLKVQSFAIEADAFAQLNEKGEKITDQSADKTPMKPETALRYALDDIKSFNPFN